MSERADFKWMAPGEQRGVAFPDELCGQSIGGEVRVRFGVSEAGQRLIGSDDDARRAPMRDLMGAVGDALSCDRHVQDECFYGGDSHLYLHGPAARLN